MAKSKPLGLAWRSNTLFIVSTVGIGLFTDLFLYGLIVPILPFMLRDRVNLPEDQIQSYVSALLAAYAGASVCSSPPAGIIADRVPTRQAPFLVGLVALLAATLMLFLGQSIPVLILARVLQGVSGAVVWTIGLALLLDTVGPENLGKTIGSVRSRLCSLVKILMILTDIRVHIDWRACRTRTRWGSLQKGGISGRVRHRICDTRHRLHHAITSHREEDSSEVGETR